MGTGALYLEVKRPGREADHSPPSSAEDKCVELSLHSPNTFSWRGAWLIKQRIWEYLRETDCEDVKWQKIMYKGELLR